MNKIIERILIAAAIVGLLATYGLVGTSDMQAEQENAAYTAEIMEAAKQEALNRQRAEQWHNLNKQASENVGFGGNQMNDVIEMPRRESAGLVANEVNRFSVSEIRDRVNLVQQVMKAVMQKDTHYGTIPGTPKPTLYKPGAEQLCVTFRIAQEYRIEDLSDALVARSA